MKDNQIKPEIWISDYITNSDIYLHGITKILDHKKTAYQEMYIVETGAYGKALLLDGKWQSCTGDEFLYHEALVHPAMIAHQNPQTALILGGGEGATLREVLRWKTIEKVMMVDIDGEVVEACQKYLPEMHQNAFADPRVELVIDDAINLLETTSEKWDIIISDLSDPIADGPSFQLFTQEYFTKLKKVLAPGGYVVIQAGAVSPAEIILHARLVNTLKTVFSHVHSYSSYISTFGSPWGFAIASEQPLNTRPDPDLVNQLLAEKTTGGFRLMDGISLLGMLQTLAHIREAINTYTDIFTLEKPPQL